MVSFEIEEPIEFFSESDYYLIEGEKYWRITRVKSIINQPGLNAWRAKLGEKESRRIMLERQKIGRKMHKLFELILLGNEINPNNYNNDEIKIDLDLFQQLIKNCSLTANSVEQHLWSDKYKIAGTADYIGNYKSNKKYLKKKVEPKFNDISFVIGDWKSSSGIYDDFWIQLSAYMKVFEEMTGIKPDGAFIAQFRDGRIRIEEKTYDELCKYFLVMLNCLEIFKHTKRDK